MSKWVFLDDKFVPEENAVVHFRDLSVQRGYGIFDFLKLVNAVPVFFDDHLDRFCSSAKEMHLAVRYSKNEIKNIIAELIAKNDVDNTGVRITLTGGYSADGYQVSSPNLIISCSSFTAPGPEQFHKGIRLITYPHQRQLPHVKTIDYLMGIWLQPLLKQHKADDVLYHQNGIVTECPRANFFIVTGEGRIITPSKNILKGVMRSKLIEVAATRFIVEEREITIDEIKTAKEAFITSTTKILLPVRQIDEYIFTATNNISAELYQLMLVLQSGIVQSV